MKNNIWYKSGSGRTKANPKVQSEAEGGSNLFDARRIAEATRKSMAPRRQQSAALASDVLSSAASGGTSMDTSQLDTTERLMGELGQRGGRAREWNTGRAAQDDGGARLLGGEDTSRAAPAATSRVSQSRAADSSHHGPVEETFEIQSEEDVSDEEAEPAWIDGDRGVLVASGGRVIYAPPCTCIIISSAILY